MKSKGRKIGQKSFRVYDSDSSKRVPAPGARTVTRHLTNLYGIIGLLTIAAATLGMFAFWPEAADRSPAGPTTADFLEGKPLEQIYPLVGTVSANVEIVDTQGHAVDASAPHYTVVSITYEDEHGPKIIVTREPWETQNSLGELLALYERSTNTTITVIDNTTQESLPQDIQGYTVVAEKHVSDHQAGDARTIQVFVEPIQD